jgi:hypothetical protein
MKSVETPTDGSGGMMTNIFCFALLVSLISVSLGCGTKATPSVEVLLQLDRSTVPLGGPNEALVRFTTLENYERLEGDYRVLLHFLGDDDNVLWEESHDLPLPVSTWRSGQAIEYVHRVHVPMYPYVGNVAVGISLLSEHSGEAVPLVGSKPTKWVYRAAELTLEPQEATSFLEHEDGWFPWEFSNDGSERWRWMGARAVLSFLNPRTDVALVMEFEGRPILLGTKQTLSLNSGERVLAQVDLDSNERHTLKTIISKGDLTDDDSVRLILHVDPTFVPAEYGDSIGDRRELGIRVFYSFVESHEPHDP